MRSIREALKKTKDNIFGKIVGLLRRKDPEALKEIEYILLSGDVGIETTEEIICELKKTNPDNYVDRLKEIILNIIDIKKESKDLNKPITILFVGVNGVGKTTSIGKIGYHLSKNGNKVLFVACDTFRTGAQEQLRIWADRAGIDIISSKYGADPSSVAFDAFDAAVSRNVDYLLIDTAGRLHTKVNLLDEMKKIKRTLNKKREDIPQEIFIVIDATTGQNAINQVEMFHRSVELSGIVLSKMDGTAKGGIIIPIIKKFKIPVVYAGTGEGLDDIVQFNPEEFVNELLS
uniref:Signal recognition particle receptor FtsY n=1 Tax=candidate division WOR-3 bacterium TaxID=2052148 RepID=A0A7C4Y5T6_UNCW3